MDQEALRRLIRRKLEDGRLPRGIAPRAVGRPGDWRECAACGAIIANALLMMEVYPQTKDKKAVRFHGDCYTLWKIRDSGTRPTSAAWYGLLRWRALWWTDPRGNGERSGLRLSSKIFLASALVISVRAGSRSAARAPAL
jgi:hypothetical protein